MIDLALLVGTWPAYVWLAWRTRRAAGRAGLVALWLGASAIYGYLRYRLTCSQGLTCDVGGTSPYFVSGTPYYFIHYVPVFAAIGLVAFGVASAVVDRRATGDDLPPRTLTLGTLATMRASSPRRSRPTRCLSILPSDPRRPFCSRCRTTFPHAGRSASACTSGRRRERIVII